MEEREKAPHGGKGQHGLDDKRLGQSVCDTEGVYIYIIYTLGVLYIVPTVFLGLNKLLLFGTKIVTLFGQRKNVFVKQKHSGQSSKF